MSAPPRAFIKIAAGLFKTWHGFAGGVLPKRPLRLRVTEYVLQPAQWSGRKPLRIAALADLHICEPWMPLADVTEIVRRTNTLGADLIVLLGDYTPAVVNVEKRYRHSEWAGVLGRLAAPLGVHAILGNHDWWDDPAAQRAGHGPVAARRALEQADIAVYENDAVRLVQDGAGFWLAGLADQLALRPAPSLGRPGMTGLHDLPKTLAKVTDALPVILLAHEPDIFPQVPDRVMLTLAGHTHGGQVRLFGYSPMVPSVYGNRYAYGHIIERSPLGCKVDRHLIVSGGLGDSIVPVRIGVPPEITLIELRSH